MVRFLLVRCLLVSFLHIKPFDRDLYIQSEHLKRTAIRSTMSDTKETSSTSQGNNGVSESQKAGRKAKSSECRQRYVLR